MKLNKKNDDDDGDRKKGTPDFHTLMGGAVHCSWCKRPMTYNEAQRIIDRNDGKVICDSCLVIPSYNHDKPPGYNWKFIVYCHSRAGNNPQQPFSSDWTNDFYLYRTTRLATPPRRPPGERGLCDMMAELTAKSQYNELARKLEILDKVKKETMEEDGLPIAATILDEIKNEIIGNSGALKTRCSQVLNIINESEAHSIEINNALEEVMLIITLLHRVDYFSLLIKYLNTTVIGTLSCASDRQILTLLQDTVNSVVSKGIVQHYPETTFHFLSRCIDCRIISNHCEFLGYRLKNLVYKMPWYNPWQLAKVDKALVLQEAEKFETWITRHNQELSVFDKGLMDWKIFHEINLLKCRFIRNIRTELDIDKFKKKLECLLDISNTEHSDEYREHLKRIASSHQGGHTVPDFRIHHKLMAKDISEDTYAQFMYDHQIVLHIAQLPRYSEHPECPKAMCKELAERLSISTELNQIIDGEFDTVIASQDESADVFYLKAIAYQHAHPEQPGLIEQCYKQACKLNPSYNLEYAIYLNQQQTQQLQLMQPILNKSKEYIDDEDYLLWHELHCLCIDHLK